MADVRLTATNPEDSSVVPVACDAAGRLLLEERGEGPPGPPGEQGPPGQDGDPFSGNFAGDVTFEGSAEFAGSATSTSNGSNISKLNPQGYISAQRVSTDLNAVVMQARGSTTGNPGDIKDVAGMYVDGTIKVGGTLPSTPECELNANGFAIFAGGLVEAFQDNDHGYVSIRNLGENRAYIGKVNADNIGLTNDLAELGTPICPITLNTNTGSTTFAGGKAGFTAEGYLWCTTERGDTVMLQATVGGAGLWVDYTPTTRIEEIRDKLDANRGDTGEMPADTQ